MLSEKHWEIMGIQTAQLRAKAEELRFIAKHCDRMIELMFEKAEESRIGYAEKNAYNLWRGSDIDYYIKNMREKLASPIKFSSAWLDGDE
ncbi:MAG: hypothetical protein NWE76_08440 [Candidatus Bathyarchaeota archaeon]|nr:hypothetical protein [Candidatus Bathyarchaeota archaeon]